MLAALTLTRTGVARKAAMVGESGTKWKRVFKARNRLSVRIATVKNH